MSEMKPGTRTLADDLAAYGARLGIVEPLARSTYSNLPELRSIAAALRDSKAYDLADRLRAVITGMEVDAAYAFPTAARENWGCK